MAWIQTVDPEAADGLLRQEYDEAVRRAGRVFHVLRLSSLNPEVLRAWVAVYKAVMYGPSPLARYERELAATVVSVENRCHY
jgi:alkylhydroperoxidase family enzyme